GAVSLVVEERVPAQAGHEEVRAAVVVEVADGHSQVVAAARHSGLLGHVLERPVALVAKEAVPELRTRLLQAVDGRAVHHLEVEAAGALVVEKGYACRPP